MYKVCFEDSVLSFAADAGDPGQWHVLAGLPDSIAKVLENLELYKRVRIKTEAPGEAFADFCGRFAPARAAGGLVRNSRGDALMIFRNGRWDLPKGHVEQGETLEECALREVKEECGVSGLRLCGPITETIHFYNMYDRWTIKRTAWFSMRCDGEVLTPQSEEGIMAARWVPYGELEQRLEDSYPTIREVFVAEGW